VSHFSPSHMVFDRNIHLLTVTTFFCLVRVSVPLFLGSTNSTPVYGTNSLSTIGTI
jgi:hypothetical protein